MRAVVIGASSGLGRCIGIGLARRGADVALLARRRDRLDSAASEAGPEAVAIACDLRDAALEALTAASGTAVSLSSVSASLTPPWPGLGAYAVSKAALDKLVEAWRGEHPAVGFTRLVVGDCTGGEGLGMTEFATGWDPELATEFGTGWFERKLISGSLIDVEHLIDVVDAVLRGGHSTSMPSVTVATRA